MEKTVKIEKKNKQGKIIKKEIPSNMYSLYINTGWKESKTPSINIPRNEDK